jgi:hypothetical protein
MICNYLLKSPFGSRQYCNNNNNNSWVFEERERVVLSLLCYSMYSWVSYDVTKVTGGQHSYQSESIARFIYYPCVWWQIHGISYHFLTPVQHKYQYIWPPVRFTAYNAVVKPKNRYIIERVYLLLCTVRSTCFTCRFTPVVASGI